MKVLFFDVGYTLVNEDAVWEARCREQAQTNEAKKLGLSATDIYPEIEIASIARKPQFRTLIELDGLKERLQAFDLLQYFKYIISSWDLKVMKPDIRIFEYALDKTNCSPQETCMIGDRLDNDILPAKSLGMKTVWIKQGFGALQKPLSKSEEPDYTINNLTELLKIF